MSGLRIPGEVDGRTFRTRESLSPTTTRMMPCLLRGLVRGRVRGKAFLCVVRCLNADWGRVLMLVCGRLIFGGGNVCNNNKTTKPNKCFQRRKLVVVVVFLFSTETKMLYLGDSAFLLVCVCVCVSERQWW